MKVHEFFAKYADTPLSLRRVPISSKGDLTLNDVYDQISNLEYQMLPMKIEEDKLLKLAAIVLEKKR